METENGSQKQWTNTQAYGLAVLCLLLGGTSGYLMHGSARPVQPSSAPHPAANAATFKPTEDQLKHMAEKKSEPLLEKLKQNPNDPELLAEVGKSYLYARQFKEAIEYFEKSASAKPDPRVLTTLGGVYHFTGNDERALDAWNRALKVDPNYADALVNIGLTKWQSASDPKGAIAAWQKMLATNPNHPQRAKVEQLIARAKSQMNTRAAN